MSDKPTTAQSTLEPEPAREIGGERLQACRDDRVGDERSPAGSGARRESSDHDAFAAGTIGLDVPAVAAALSQRLYAAGVPVTPERAVNLAQALNLVGPVSRRGLYYTARAVFVSAPAQLPTFDQIFASIFGSCPDGDDECAPNAGVRRAYGT